MPDDLKEEEKEEIPLERDDNVNEDIEGKDEDMQDIESQTDN